MKKPLSFLVLFIAVLLYNSCSKENTDSTETVDTTPPKVELQIVGFENSSDEPIVVGNAITVYAVASDNDKLKSASLSINGEVIAQSSTAPFSFTIDISSYSSKGPNPENFKEYLLEIEVSDVSNNLSKVEQYIYIDNDLPAIFNVSMENGVILNGSENIITFSAQDNQELKQLTGSVGNIQMEVLEDRDGYYMNLNTLPLNNGENTLVLKAYDYGGNTVIYSILFITDNSGPNIIVEGVSVGEIIGESITITPSINDDYSQLSNLKVFLDEDLLHSFDSFDQISFDVNPEDYPTGIKNLKFEASDSLGNNSTVSIPIHVGRLLITIDIPDRYISPRNSTKKLFYLASDKNGKVLDFVQGQENSKVKLYSKEEFSPEEKFTLTMIEISGNLNGSQVNEVFSIGHLTRQEKQEYKLKPNINYDDATRTPFKITGLDSPCTTNISAGGTKYFEFHSSGSEDFEIWSFMPLDNQSLKTDKIYLFLDLFCAQESKYIVFDNPIPDSIDKNIDISDFIDTDILKATTSFSNVGFGSIEIFGFNSLDDYRLNINHQLDRAFRNTSLTPGPIEYFWLDKFPEYKHEIISKDFVRIGRGLPESNYQVPNWTIDHSLSNGKIDFSISTGQHSVGKVIIDTEQYDWGNFLDWIYIFNSQDTQQIVLPELPEALKEYQIYDVFNQDNFVIHQSQITDYKDISSYEEYIQKIIKPNTSYQSFGDQMTAKYKLRDDSKSAFIIGDFFLYR